MDNLLEKTVQFLLIPESVLSVIFLAIFILVFAYGVYRVKQCQATIDKFSENAVEEIKNEENHSTAQQVISRFLAELTAKEVSITGLPNIFISIGILGTFIGLGVAIHGAADLLSGDKVDLAQLNAILSVIAFKFQNSIWGTLFSLVFQKFVLEPYFVNRQSKLNATDSAIYKEVTNPGLAINELCARQRSIDTALIAQQKAIFGDSWEDIVNGKTQLVSGKDGKNYGMYNNILTLGDQMLGTDWESNISRELPGENGTDGKNGKSADGKDGKNGKPSMGSLLQNVASLQTLMQEQHEQLIGDTNNANKQSAKEIMSNISKAMDEQRTYAEKLSKDLAAQQQVLLGDTMNSGKKSILSDVASQLTEQRKYIDNLTNEQLKLNEALLGDMQQTNLSTANSMREGIVRQMEEYKIYAEALAAKQKATQDSLEKKLQDVMGSMDRNYESSNNSIAELQRAIDILQAAINENSRVLADIVEQFYTKQNNLDKLRRSEIMGIADTFTTLLQQEGKKTAPWNKEPDKK